MAEAARKRESESLDLGGGGGSEPKKAKTTETEVDMSQPESMSQSSSLMESRSLLPRYSSRWWQDKVVGPKYFRLKELEGFLISKGTSDEIIHKIMHLRSEDAYSPHEEDVQKALEGFDRKGWHYFGQAPHGYENLHCHIDFSDHDLYRQLVLVDYHLPLFTTFEGDKQCLSFIQEFQQEVRDFKSKGPNWEQRWHDEGWAIAYELSKNYPQVVAEQFIYAVEDVNDTANWGRISSELEGIFFHVWAGVVEEGLRFTAAFGSACNVTTAMIPGEPFLRVFENPSLGALLKDTFNVVANKSSSSSSEEEIEQLFKEALLENSSKLMEYYPQYIRKKMEIAKQIGII